MNNMSVVKCYMEKGNVLSEITDIELSELLFLEGQSGLVQLANHIQAVNNKEACNVNKKRPKNMSTCCCLH